MTSPATDLVDLVHDAIDVIGCLAVGWRYRGNSRVDLDAIHDLPIRRHRQMQLGKVIDLCGRRSSAIGPRRGLELGEEAALPRHGLVDPSGAAPRPPRYAD
jgi:hypothetical protein